MGLVIVIVDALFAGYDGVPDPLGWVLVLTGLWPLRRLLDTPGLVPAAVVSLLVALVTYPPQVAGRLDDTAGWALSLPQLAFGFLLCGALAAGVPSTAGRFRVLRWLFVVLALGPVLVLGGGVGVLRDPLAFLAVAAQLYLVYLLFRCSGELRAGGPTTREPPAFT